jgi:hypothetical protein
MAWRFFRLNLISNQKKRKIEKKIEKLLKDFEKKLEEFEKFVIS